MRYGIKRLIIRTLQLGIMLFLASSANGSSLTDAAHSLMQQAWESEYIPESTVPVVPLTDYEDFEVVELFRAETIEELEASLTDGYPYPWLEETLRDETIPWEDRYWLDRRVRAAISQNLHVFYDTENNPVYVDADCIFPGEPYWREHMIVDLVGMNVPEGTERPAGFELSDFSYLYSPYGYMKGKYPFAYPIIAISRDGSIGAFAGIVSLSLDEMFPVEPFEFIIFPDGSYKEVIDDPNSDYDVAVAPDGSVVVFFSLSDVRQENEIQDEDIYVFSRNGDLVRSFVSTVPLGNDVWLSVTSEDGRYACHYADNANACLINCIEGTTEIVSEPAGYFRSCDEFNFSPDGRYVGLGGATLGQLYDTETGETVVFSETAPADQDTDQPYTTVTSSNEGFCVVLTTWHRTDPVDYYELNIYINNNRIHNDRITSFGFTVTDVSPNGYYLIVNPQNAAHGHPVRSNPDVFNLPLILMQIEGR